jgi:tetratricopeptide (TPR) repeat protein
MRTLAGLLGHSLTSTETVISTSALQTAAPPLPPIFAPRTALVGQVKRLLGATSLVLLQGSTGMGKTILAALVVRSEPSFMWTSLRGLTAREIAAVLIQLSKSIDTDATISRVVLDDINFSPEFVRLFERVLAGLVYTIANRRGWLLATSQKAFPTTIERQLAPGPNATVTVRGFQEEEIVDLARSLGCPSGPAKQWSKLIATQTNSHPQLVHARLLTVARRGWPPLRQDDFLEIPRELTEERMQTRMLLAELPKDDVELLYRLSLIAGLFRRDHAVAIGQIEPALTNPGDAFDKLVGPWVEPVNETYFRLSPLLERAADAVWGPEKATQWREPVGEALLRCRSLTLVEASTIMWLGFVTRSRHLLFVITNALLKQRVPLEKHIAQSIAWVAFIKTDPCVRIFPESSSLNWMLRLLQFQVAMSLESDGAPAIVDCLDQETTFEQMGDGYRLARFLFLTQTLAAIPVELSPAKLLYLIGEAEKTKVALLEAGEGAVVKSFEAILVGLSYGSSGLVARLFLFVAARCNGPQFLENLMSALRGADDSLRSQFSDFIVHHQTDGRLLMDRVWLEEEKRSDPDWERCVAAFESAASYGRAFGVEELIDLAVRAIMIVTDEYLNDRARALRAFESIGAYRENPGHVLIDEYAQLLTNDGQHLEALKLWARILPNWEIQQGSPDSLPAFARRRAAVAAARAGILDQSSRYFQEGASQASIAGELVLSAGMVADAAFVEWKRGRADDAIALFTDVLQRLDQMPNTKDELTSFKLRKLTGQMLNHIRSACVGVVTEDSYAPPIGSASDLDASDRLRELPITSPDMLWLSLVQAEAALGTPPRAFELVNDRLARSRIPAVTWFLAEVHIIHKLRSRDLSNLPNIAERYSDVYNVLVSIRDAGGSGVDPAEPDLEYMGKRDQADALAPQVLFTGLISVIGSGQQIDPVLTIWRDACEGLRLREKLTEWIGLAEQPFSLDMTHADAVMRAGEKSRDERILAALKVASDDDIDVESLFYSHVTITTAIAETTVRTIAAEHLSEIVSRQWREKTNVRQVLHATRAAGAINVACDMVLPPLQKLGGHHPSRTGSDFDPNARIADHRVPTIAGHSNDRLVPYVPPRFPPSLKLRRGQRRS